MNMDLETQIKSIDPSAKGALFRRIIYEKPLAFLRPDQGHIYGFDVDLNKSKPLAGMALIGIQKHTILAYKSDLGEEDRLILFPSIDKIKENEFDLGSLTVKLMLFGDESFRGKTEGEGLLKDLAEQFMPKADDPHSQQVFDKMSQTVAKEEKETPKTQPTTSTDPIETDEPPTDYPDFDDMDNVNEPDDVMAFDQYADSEFYNDGSDYDDDEDDDEPAYNEEPSEAIYITDQRGIQLNKMSKSFNSVNEVVSYVVKTYNVNADLANNVANAAIQKAQGDKRMQVDLAIILFIKLFDMGKIGDNEGAF